MQWAEPMHPEASSPCVSVERTHGENTPLLRLPCRVEPKRLGKHPEDAGPPSPSCTLVLRKPDGDDAAKGDADLIQARGLLSLWRRTFVEGANSLFFGLIALNRIVRAGCFNSAVYGLGGIVYKFRLAPRLLNGTADGRLRKRRI